jgi:hypothetical protein
MNHMNAQSYWCAKASPSVLSFNRTTEPCKLLDVGGGSSIFLFGSGQGKPNYPRDHLRTAGHQSSQSRKDTYIAEADLSDRGTVEVGGFFTDDLFPSPVDVVLVSNRLHDWPDNTNII